MLDRLADMFNCTFSRTELPIDAEPYIPLNYSLIDHQEIFKRIEQNDVTEILDYLKTYDESKWPYVDNSIEYSDWCIDEQPITNVQVNNINYIDRKYCKLIFLTGSLSKYL